MNSAEPATPPNDYSSFLEELADYFRRLPDKGLFAVLLVAWLALFHFLGNSTLGYFKTHSIFGWLKWIWDTTPDEGHIALVPAVVLVLYWWKRDALLKNITGIWWPALGLVVLGLLLHLMGFVIQQTRVSIVGFFIGLFGITGLIWGRQWLRHSFFPYFLFAFCLPLASVAEPVTFRMRLLVAQIVSGISQVMGIDVIRDGTQLYNLQHTFAYDVAPACSGIRSLISLLAITTIYGFVAFRAPVRRGIMVLSAFPLALLGNVCRITFTIVTAEFFGQKAGEAVEQKFGFVTFLVAIGCMLLLGYLIRERETPPALRQEAPQP